MGALKPPRRESTRFGNRVDSRSDGFADRVRAGWKGSRRRNICYRILEELSRSALEIGRSGVRLGVLKQGAKLEVRRDQWEIHEGWKAGDIRDDSESYLNPAFDVKK